jgi:putative endonuclease
MTRQHGQSPGRLESLFPPADPAAAGRWGERRAEEFLRRARGCRILARNWRNPRDRREEIDLVAAEGPVLVFAEVKLRAAEARVPGYYAVDRRKRRAWRRAVRAYLAGLPVRPRTFRCDVVEVASGPAGPVVRHFANVGLFGKDFTP